MKSNVIRLIGFMTLCLFAFVVMSSLGVAYSLLISMLIAAKTLFIYTVYRVLTENYHTDKKFKDWYADIPKKELYRQ
ncbi:hypothetical protein [uncultured Flavobacterium sp.]|uniref:hypothetical protein n=1 Tax=uncultured Flavobacterium sp. TaxID=165435 RepID=UPI0025E5B6BB|nr:hypothetical protein [uncultured Flavobacterium sp.]